MPAMSLKRVPLKVIGCSESPAPFQIKKESEIAKSICHRDTFLFYKACKGLFFVTHSLEKIIRSLPVLPGLRCDANARSISRAYLSHLPSDWNHDQPIKPTDPTKEAGVR